ncbi:MAG: SprT family zinc-dependent metalloprotease [Candidatus Limnocylindrales bacterium]
MPVDERITTVYLPGGPVDYTLRHSPRARSLRVLIHPERGVVVTVPATRAGRATGERRAAEFLGQREAWLRRHLLRQEQEEALLAERGGARDGGAIPYRGDLHRVWVVPAVSGIRRSDVVHLGATRELIVHRVARETRIDAAIMERWLREQAREAIDDAIGRHAPVLAVAPTAVTLRDPRSRWGSASRQGRLSFSWRLVLAPPAALETVVVHELAHLRVFGHGPLFWALVASVRPDHRTWRRWLHDHATGLHAALVPRPDPPDPTPLHPTPPT